MRKAFLEVRAEGIQGDRMQFSTSERHKGWKPKIWKNTLGMTMSTLFRAFPNVVIMVEQWLSNHSEGTLPSSALPTEHFHTTWKIM